MVVSGPKAEDSLARRGLEVFYLITGPAAACLFARLAADKLGLWLIPQTPESLSFVLHQIASLLFEFFGLPIAVLTIAAAVLTRRRWRDLFPLWFLAAGTGVGWFAERDAESAALGGFAYLSLLLYGLSATWIACRGGISRLASYLARRSS
jgi:hypothetical protein